MVAGLREARPSGAEAVHAQCCAAECDDFVLIFLDLGCQESQKERERGGCVHVWSGVKRNATRNTNLLSDKNTSQLRCFFSFAEYVSPPQWRSTGTVSVLGVLSFPCRFLVVAQLQLQPLRTDWPDYPAGGKDVISLWIQIAATAASE